MKKSILFSVFAFCATVLQAQTIVNTSQDCAKNDKAVDLRAFVSHSGWNGKGNSRLEYSQMDLSGIADYIYSHNNEFGKFELKTAAGCRQDSMTNYK